MGDRDRVGLQQFGPAVAVEELYSSRFFVVPSKDSKSK